MVRIADWRFKAINKSEQPTKKMSDSLDTSEAETIVMPAPDKFPELFKPWYPGKEIEGLYRIEEEIASGGMGVVHKATDLATNNFVVIKSLLPQVAQVDEYKKRFIREAEEWVALGAHPNIVRAYTAHEIEYLPRLVLEYIDGCSLDDLLYEEGILPLDSALDIAVQICWGMAYAHDKGLIHRDLKPANIMIAKDDAVKVTDFGLVKRIMEKAEKQLLTSDEILPIQTLMTQGIIGTPEYIAPEQWEEEESQSSDIYAFGVILYEIFCGQRPFDFAHLKGMDRITAYQTAHCLEPPQEPDLIREDLPSPIGQLLVQCLAKDPEQRPKTFRHVASKIDSIAKQLIGESFRKEPSTEDLNRHDKLDQANAYLRLGIGCLFRGDLDRAADLYKTAYQIFQDWNDQKGIAKFLRCMGAICVDRGEYDRAVEMYEESMEISKVQGDQLGVSSSFLGLGIVFQHRGDYDHSMMMHHKCLEICEKLADRTRMTACYMNIGNILRNQGDYDRAMDMYQKSMEISETLGARPHMTASYMNMGNIFLIRGEFDRAMEIYQKNLEIDEALGDRSGMSFCYMNMGIVFKQRGDYDSAMDMYQKSLELREALGNRSGMSFCYMNMGNIVQIRGDHNLAMEMYHKSLKIQEELGDRTGISMCYTNMGATLNENANYDQAIVMHKKCLEIVEESGDKRVMGYAYKGLGIAYHQKKDFDQALEWLQKSIEIWKSIGYCLGICDSLHELGKLYSEQGKTTEALAVLNESLTIMTELGTPIKEEVEKLIAELTEQSNKE
ncbi:tetratricopeptide repeat protein [Planctomycetota bacterium]